MSDSHGPIFRSTTSILSISAAAALALAACAPDDAVEDGDATQEDTAQEDQPQDDQTQDDQQDDTIEAEDTSDEGETDAADDDATEDDAEEDAEAGGEGPVYEVADAIAAEYPEGVIATLEDQGSYFEVDVFDLGSEAEYEFDIDAESHEISSLEQDDLDGDDRSKAEAVEIDFLEAVQTAESEGGDTIYEAELDTEDGTVVWEIQLQNGTDVYVDVATGEVVKTDS